MTGIRYFALGALLVALVAAPALAGPQTGAPGGESWQAGQRQGRGAPGEGLSVQEIERQFDQFEIVEAQRALSMDDESFRVVSERLQRIQIMRRRHQVQRRQLLRELREAVDAGTVEENEAAVIAKLTELGGLGVRQAQEMRRAVQALDSVLTVRQRAQFRLFQERFERQKLDLLARARQGRGRGGQAPAEGRPPV